METGDTTVDYMMAYYKPPLHRTFTVPIQIYLETTLSVNPLKNFINSLPNNFITFVKNYLDQLILKWDDTAIMIYEK